MITYNELLHGHLICDVPISAQQNLEILLKKMNSLRLVYNKPMIVTSGFRNLEDQRRINPNSMRSKHLTGQACDIYDPDGELKLWVTQNEPLLESIGLWCEDFSVTPTWVHFQIVPPASNKRFFMP